MMDSYWSFLVGVFGREIYFDQYILSDGALAAMMARSISMEDMMMSLPRV